MANFTGADVITVSDVQTYQPDAFDFGIASNDSKVTTWLGLTTDDILITSADLPFAFHTTNE